MNWELIWLLTLVLVVVVIIAGVAFYYINEYLNKNVRMALYADMPTSLKNESIFLNFVNVNKNIDFWQAHEADLKLYAMGVPVEGIFYRSPDVPNGYKIAYATSLLNIEVLSLMSAIKYNMFEVSWDNGESRIPINFIKDKETRKLSKKMQQMKHSSSITLKNRVLQDITNDLVFENSKHNISNRVISHMNVSKTTTTTIRFQAIISPEHPMFQADFVPGGPHTRFYYTYNGRCYEIESIFIGQVENFYEWDLIGLEPGTIYAGFSFSINEQQVIVPSTSLYGITKDPITGLIPSIDDAVLAKPSNPNEKSFDMWGEETTFNYLGENLLRRLCDILVKKHHELNFPEEYINLNNVAPFYEENKWLEFGLKYKSKAENK